MFLDFVLLTFFSSSFSCCFSSRFFGFAAKDSIIVATSSKWIDRFPRASISISFWANLSPPIISSCYLRICPCAFFFVTFCNLSLKLKRSFLSSASSPSLVPPWSAKPFNRDVNNSENRGYWATGTASPNHFSTSAFHLRAYLLTARVNSIFMSHCNQWLSIGNSAK